MQVVYGPIIIVAAMAVVGGMALVAIGWRGRRVGDHPYCARCGFDLFGRPEESQRCPECGTDITHPGAIRTGQRQLRPRPLWLGTALLVPGLLVLAVVGLALFDQIDLNRYKPVAWLLWQADLSAADELNRRHIARLFTAEQLQRIVDRILVFQADPDRPWLTEWGDLLERARASGEVDDEQWRLYARQAVSLQMVVRPRVRRGDPIPVEVRHDPIRTASPSGLWIRVRVSRAFLEHVPVEIPKRNERRDIGWPLPINNWIQIGEFWPIASENLHLDIESLKDLSDEEMYELRADVEITLWDAPQVNRHQLGRPLLVREIPLSDWVMLLPEKQPSVDVIDDPQMRPMVLLDVYEMRIEEKRLRLTIRAHTRPMGSSFAIRVRDSEGLEWPLKSVTFPADESWGKEVSVWFVGRDVDDLDIGWLGGFDADEVDIILRSDPDAAVATVDLTEIWDGEIVYENVPVRWAEDAPRPIVLHE